MKSFIVFLFLASAVGRAQTARFEMPMLGSPLPASKFELVNKIPAEQLRRLPKELPSYKWSVQPRVFPSSALQTLLDTSSFSGTNAASLFPSGTNQIAATKLASADNQDYFIVIPAASRIALQNTDRSREYPPPDAVPDFAEMRKRALHFAELFEVSTNDMEHDTDGSIHFSTTENTTSHLGGSVKYKSRRSVTVCRSIGGYLVRSLDEDKIQLELGVNGRLLKFDLKWPNIEAVHTNKVLAITQILEGIKKGNVLADSSNEYPPGGIAEIEIKDYQVFYYVSAMFPYGRRMVTTPNPDIQPMIEFLATFKARNGTATEGGLFAPLTESQ